MHGLGVQTVNFHGLLGKCVTHKTYFSQGVFGAWQKQNILGPSTLQALSIFDIYFITRRDIFYQKSRRGCQ